MEPVKPLGKKWPGILLTRFCQWFLKGFIWSITILAAYVNNQAMSNVKKLVLLWLPLKKQSGNIWEEKVCLYFCLFQILILLSVFGFCYIHVNLFKSWVFPISLNIWLKLSKLTFSIFSLLFWFGNHWELRVQDMTEQWTELRKKTASDLLRRDCIRSSSLTTQWANFRELNLGYTSHSWKKSPTASDPEQMLETSESNWWGEVAER